MYQEGVFREPFSVPAGASSARMSCGLAPVIQVVYNRVSAASRYDPHDILVRVIDLLMLSVRWYKGEVSRRELFSLLAVRSAHDGTMTTRCVYDRVWKTIRSLGAKVREV
jgi:hypothetical protein